LSKVANFNLPNWTSGGDPVWISEFYRDFWRQQTRVPDDRFVALFAWSSCA